MSEIMRKMRNAVPLRVPYIVKQTLFPKARPVVQYIKNMNNKELIGAEIGVYKGEHAKSILNELDIKRLYLIDPYDLYVDYNQGMKIYGMNENQHSLNDAEKIARDRLKEYADKIEWIKKKSEDAVNSIPDNLDFVYIDANHDYEYVKQDMELYYPKVKVGGIFGGHDTQIDGVLRAFVEFMSDKKEYFIAYADWWMVKEK